VTIVYQPDKYHKTHSHFIHNTLYKVHTWGRSDTTPVFLLHGWADTGTSFQFMAAAMDDDWFLIAPDWLGFGESGWSRTGYWIPDYLAALEALIDIYSPQQEVILVGHSMGGNIACMYAGLRPKRVSHLVNMEGFGLPDTNPEDAHERYVKWLDQKKTPSKFSTYKSFEKLARLIQKQAHYITHERAIFIARQWAKEVNDGVVKLKADPAHKIINPILYRREEAKSCWRNVTARILLVLGSESSHHENYFKEEIKEEFNRCFNNMEIKVIDHAGHMLHHDQPEETATILEAFLRQ